MKNPVSLSQVPVTMSLIDASYSHQSQMRFTGDLSSDSVEMASTIGGTATYNSQGQPRDNDND